jgi:hypothetical protein
VTHAPILTQRCRVSRRDRLSDLEAWLWPRRSGGYVEVHVGQDHPCVITTLEEVSAAPYLCLNVSVGIKRGRVVFEKSTLEAVLIIVGVLIVSSIMGWLAWNTFGFLVADAPEVVKLKSP